MMANREILVGKVTVTREEISATAYELVIRSLDGKTQVRIDSSHVAKFAQVIRELTR